MAQTTFEEACTCPRCKVPGEVVSVLPGDRKSKVHTLLCHTPGCPWEGTNWIVQVQQDGSIPTRTAKKDKDFPEIPSWLQNKARRDIELVEHEVETGIITGDE